MTEIDQDTLKKAAHGDQKAFRVLYDTYSPFVWRVVYRTAGSDQDMAAEIVQDTFIRVFRSLRKFNQKSALSTWIYRIAFSVSQTILIQRIRKRKRLVALDDDLRSTETSDSYESQQMANRILKTLDPQDRFILTMREIEDVSFDELEQITGIKSGALRVRLHRIKQTIREKLSNTFYDSKGSENEHPRGSVLQGASSSPCCAG